MALGCVCAMFPGVSKAHGSHASCAPRPYKSVQVRIPLPAPCALHKVLCQPTAPLLRPSSLRYAAASNRLSVAYCEPCAPEIPWYMAHTLSCAYPSILSIPSIPSWPCPQYRLCAMRSASQQTTQPCAPEIPWYMAHSLSCAYPSILSILSIPSWPCPQYRHCTFTSHQRQKCARHCRSRWQEW